MTQYIEKLTDKQLEELIFAITKTGRIVIPLWYNSERIEKFKGSEPSQVDILDIQEAFENDWATQDYIDKALEENIKEIEEASL